MSRIHQTPTSGISIGPAIGSRWLGSRSGHRAFKPQPQSTTSSFNPLDGSSGAPSGTAQHAGLLSSYAHRPSWRVAGVDYAVGIDRVLYPTNADLKAPMTATLPTGVSRDTTNHIFSVTGSNVVLDGWDFSLNGGWEVDFNGGSGNTLSNCNFAPSSTNPNNGAFYVSSSASNTTIRNCEIVGQSGSTQQILGAINGIGTTTLLYNLIDSAYGQCLVFSSDVGGETLDIRYNVISNAGLGFSAGAHGDWIQLYNAIGKNTTLFNCQYNLWLQSIQIANGRTQGVSAFSANSGSTSGGCQTETYENNVMIGVSGAYVNFGIIIDTTRLIGSATVSNNYFDLSGIGSSNGGGGGWIFVGNYNGASGGPYNGAVTITTDNIDMNSGAVLST